MKPYSNITIHHRFSSSVQKEKYLLSYNGQYYEASHAIVELVEELQRYEEEEVAIGAYIQKKRRQVQPGTSTGGDRKNSSLPFSVQYRRSGLSFTKKNCSVPGR